MVKFYLYFLLLNSAKLKELLLKYLFFNYTCACNFVAFDFTTKSYNITHVLHPLSAYFIKYVCYFLKSCDIELTAQHMQIKY